MRVAHTQKTACVLKEVLKWGAKFLWLLIKFYVTISQRSLLQIMECRSKFYGVMFRIDTALTLLSPNIATILRPSLSGACPSPVELSNICDISKVSRPDCTKFRPIAFVAEPHNKIPKKKKMFFSVGGQINFFRNFLLIFCESCFSITPAYKNFSKFLTRKISHWKENIWLNEVGLQNNSHKICPCIRKQFQERLGRISSIFFNLLLCSNSW